jgi:transcription antitermination protein NusB
VASRRQGRRQAVDIVYQSDVTGRDPLEVLNEWEAAGKRVSVFAAELVQGVGEYLAELDGLIGSAADGWTIDRLASLDRTILRVAAYEILHRNDVPTAVAIDEAVATAKELSTEDSGRFVNGVLGQIARRSGETEPPG